MGYAIRRAAVIGSGTMGGAIAALLANVGIPVDLLDIAPLELTPDEEENHYSLSDTVVRNRIVQKGWDAVLKSRPAALESEDRASLVQLGNLEDDWDRLAEADWIIEVVVERLDIKQALMARIDETRKPSAVITTNTSGIPIHAIAEGRSDGFRRHFLGTHFFNPPRYLKLLEIIPHSDTLPGVLNAMVEFGEATLGKGVVICKDTPNFIANRFFSLAGAYEVAYALDHGYSVQEIDALAGPLIGRPKSAVFRLLDLVGLDVMDHVNRNLYEPIAHDESRDLLRHPGIVKLMGTMMENGWLGSKSGQGFYKTVMKDDQREFWTLDFDTMDYSAPKDIRFESVGQFRKLEPTGARVRALIGADDRAGQFIRDTTFHRLTYSARRIPEISDTLVNIDRAIRWGFAEELGPFELWDELGVAETVASMRDHGFEVPAWVDDMLAAGCPTFYQSKNGVQIAAYDLQAKAYVPFVFSPREISVGLLKAERSAVLDENDDASLLDLGDGIGLLEWHTKAQTITSNVVAMAWSAIERLNDGRLDGLVIGHDGSLFCGGANLDVAGLQQQATQQGKTPSQIVDSIVNDWQQMMLGLRYTAGPVIAAAFDRVLGGGAELMMAADRVVAHSELYVGQVEVGMGLVPAAGGSKELLRRIVNPVMRIENADPLPPLAKVFELIGLAKVSASAAEAREMGFLAATDRIIANRDHLIAEAKREALHLIETGYRPPMPEKIYAAGRDVLAALRTQVCLLHDAAYASDHDALIANKIAWVLCGGDLSAPAWVDKQFILDLERQAFVELIQEPKTVERIFAMLQTGKPLRN